MSRWMLMRGVGVLAYCLATSSFGAVTLYVDDDAPPLGDGKSWSSAFRYAQDAFSVAMRAAEPRVIEIRIAQGWYQPNIAEGVRMATSDRAATFQLLSGVRVYGGYAGVGAPNPDERDPDRFITTLTGYLGDEHSYHVVTGSGCGASAELDGVHVVYGVADGPAPFDRGAGMYIGRGSPTISDCVFKEHRAVQCGAGMYIHAGAPAIKDCVFLENELSWGGIPPDGAGPHDPKIDPRGGAGVCNHLGGAHFSRCSFSGNYSLVVGGAMYNVGGAPTITECVIEGNFSVGSAAGMANVDCDAVVTRTQFINNLSFSSGGAMTNSNSDPTIIDCLFHDNDGDWTAGAMLNSNSDPLMMSCVFTRQSAFCGSCVANHEDSNPIVIGCTFDGNYAGSIIGEGGAFVSHAECDPLVIDCVFTNNTGYNGGAVFNTENHAVFIRCRLEGNQALFYGGGMCNRDAQVELASCAFMGNLAWEDIIGAGGGVHHAGGQLTVTNCTVFGNRCWSGDETPRGGGICAWSCDAEIASSIMCGNAAGANCELDGCNGVTVTSCAIAGCGGSGMEWCIEMGADGGGNLDVDPCFAAPGWWEDPHETPDRPYDDEWIEGGFRLAEHSPCVNAGDPAYSASPGELDLNGALRVQHCRVDIGAYESPSSGEYDCNLNGVPDACDIELEMSLDDNANGVPDECEGDPCPWDVAPVGAGDGVVGLGDLNRLLSNWGACPTPPAICPWDFAPDVGDGVVGLGDLSALLSHWGPCE